MNNQLLKLNNLLDRVPLTSYERSEAQAIIAKASQEINRLQSELNELKNERSRKD